MKRRSRLPVIVSPFPTHGSCLTEIRPSPEFELPQSLDDVRIGVRRATVGRRELLQRGEIGRDANNGAGP
jgi:hypothetical protein